MKKPYNFQRIHLPGRPAQYSANSIFSFLWWHQSLRKVVALLYMMSSMLTILLYLKISHLQTFKAFLVFIQNSGKLWLVCSIAWQFLSGSLWQTSTQSYPFGWDPYVLNNEWTWPRKRKVACWGKQERWSFSESTEVNQMHFNECKKELWKKEKVLFWWEILEMFVGHNTHSNSLLSFDSIRNSKLWINALNENCVPDVILMLYPFSETFFYPIKLSACTAFQLNR